VKWSKDYATGIEQIDRDHQMIFRLIVNSNSRDDFSFSSLKALQ
jgi:hemerythrin